MNKNKLIFAIIGGILVILLLVLLLMGKSSSSKPTAKSSSGDFTIWIVGDSKQKFQEFLSSFKEAHKSEASLNYIVESFSDYEDYSRALGSAMIKGVAPDVFVLNNNETSIFEEKTSAIPSSIININDFRKNYKGIFNDDLIIKSEEKDGEGQALEYLKGVPVGYETLGVFYNRKFRFKISDFNSLASLNSAISTIKLRNITPLALGNGSTILDAGDILAQFFLLNKVSSLAEADSVGVKKAVGEYTRYGATDSDNAYNSLFVNATSSGKDNIDLFVNQDVAAIVAYPRIIKKLEALGFSKNLLFAEPFPHSFSGEGATLANYNYFVINSETSQKTTADKFMEYLNSDEGIEVYLKKYSYYLPAKLSFESDMQEQKISNYFENVVLGDFYSEEELSSFDKANKVIYDSEVKDVLDDFSSYLSSFNTFKEATLCKAEKNLNLTNLGESCD